MNAAPLLLTLLLPALACWRSAQAIQPGLSSDFRQWLQANGYPAAMLARDDVSGGSFGGRASAGETPRRQPVIFVHGNSDRALGGQFGGWQAQVAYFESRGYQPSELYATTWGPADSSQALLQTHSHAYVSHLRTFVEAVLAYTGADMVDIVSHSMGVTLARKVIKGGLLEDKDLGAPLTTKVDTFVGIAGGNYGLTSCYTGQLLTACNNRNGFYPGRFNFLTQQVVGRSVFLEEMLQGGRFEGSYSYSMYSPDDEVLLFGCIVYGRVTCHFPGMTGDKKLAGLSHLALKDATGSFVYAMVTDHVIQ